MTKKFNSTLLSMGRRLDEPQKEDWKKHVGRLAHDYNCTTHSSTSYSYYYLMHGHHPLLPFISPECENREVDYYDEYMDNIREQLQEAYGLALQKSKVASSAQKEGYDEKAKGATPEVGDLVLVWKLGVKGKTKMLNKYER